MDGIHLLAEWFGCPAQTREFTESSSLRELCLRLVRESGLTIVGDHFHQFEPQGVTGTVVLSESHLAIHTWPEKGCASVDVYVCNFTTDNTAKAQHLFDSLRHALRPAHAREQTIRRSLIEPVRKAA